MTGRVRVGIGGWNYEPWHHTFYPRGWPARRELEYASRQVSMIEINSTFYRTQSESSYAKWHDETPEGFVFAVKALRYATQKKLLAEAGDSVRHFLGSGLARLRGKLGPVLWQFAPFKRFDAADLRAFLQLLPPELDGLPLRHVLEVRHASFMTPAFIDLVREHQVAVVATDSEQHPSFGDLTADFVYLRLVRAASACDTGYPAATLDAYAACAQAWARGEEPAGMPRIVDTPAPARPRDVYMLMINGAKERAPAAAMGVLRRLGWTPPPEAAALPPPAAHAATADR
jgi:uncharacterized protein YecE (DUF72 family)